MKRLASAALILAVGVPMVASAEDDLTSLSYISYLERYATVQPATSDDTIEAVINMPLMIGDRIDTARETRMETVLADGSVLWLDEYTTISLDAVAFSRDVGGDRTVIYLVDGSVMIQVPEHVLGTEPMRIDSSGATIHLDQAGTYRIEVLRSGGLRVEVWDGLAEALTTAGGVLIQPSTAAEVRGGQVTGVEPNLTWGDDFARWVEQRRTGYDSESSRFVDERYAREAAVLDGYGTWVYVDATQSWAWQPSVSGDWRPYTAGRWYWTPTGWSWISYEPWGWLPYHYGSWYFAAGFGWVWGWGSVWSPAWVSWAWWPGYIGWVPWGYYNTWCWGRYPGWGWGYHPPGHPHPPGSGQPRPPRGDVVPPRDGVNPGGENRRQTPDPRVRATGDSGAGTRRVTPGESGSARATSSGRTGADLTGRVRVADIDRTGWNVVAVDDFDSQHLSRVVRSGARAMPDDATTTGVVVTGPLTTRSPSVARPSNELTRSFSGVYSRTDRDITRVMARDSSLRGEDLARLVEPTSLSDLGRRSAQSIVARRSPERGAAGTRSAGDAPSAVDPAVGRRSPELSAAGTAFGAPSEQRTVVRRSSEPNIYRPGRVPATTSGGARAPIDPGTNPLVRSGARSPSGTLGSSGRTLPTTRSTSTLPRTRSWSSLPSSGSSSSPLVRQPVSPRVGSGRSGSSVSSSRPVIVPRTSPMRPSRTMGTSSPYRRSPSSIRSAPSSGRSSSSVRSPSRSSAGSSSVRSSGSSRPSVSSSSSSRSSTSSGTTRSRRK
ncbi:MAG: FecR domain-containing protein [Holophagae bacterium]|jgi:hypothetical protein